jgi:hypothetical protein
VFGNEYGGSFSRRTPQPNHRGRDMRVLIEGVLGRFSIMLALGLVPLAAIAQGASQLLFEVKSSMLPAHVDTAPDLVLDRGPFTFAWTGSYRHIVARAEVPVFREMPARPRTPDAELDQVGIQDQGILEAIVPGCKKPGYLPQGRKNRTEMN